jgi:CheY-like chemotaxis protein
MEAIGRLAGGVAHDFNNLLTVITGYSERLQSSLAEADPLRRAADAIRRSADRAASLTQQLLAFSRRQILAPSVFEPNAAITGVQKLLARMLGEDVRLEVSLGADAGHVMADPHQIEQVLLNLAVNSRDAMPEGGTLTLRTRQVRAADAAQLATLWPGDTALVEIAVADTGCGMDEETLSHLFEPFFTTKPQSKGTGLGLPTVYGIVQQSSGRIFVDSAPGRGTTFRIYLPRVDAPVQAPGTTPKAGPPGAGETILLVEDEEPVRTLLRDVLRRFGYTVLEAPDGPEAEEASAAHPGTIDLLLTDLVMPRMNGMQVAASITGSRPGTRVLYMSGFTDHPLVQRGVADGRMAFIAKPFTPEGLARKIREVLG